MRIIFNEQKVYIRFGTPGHEGEYVINIDGYNFEKYIPTMISNSIMQALGKDWEISNRGSRIEISSRKRYGLRDDQQVLTAVKNVLEPLGFII